MNKHVHIIGGGVVGLCTAYYLNKDGFEVTIIDKCDFKEGTSFGNAGMIVPSHFIPFASPGMISKGIKWMFNNKSPFYIQPKLSISLLQWLFKFYRSCSHKHVLESMGALFEFNEWSKQLYKEIIDENQIDCDFEERGLLMLYNSKKQGAIEDDMANMANEFGLTPKKLTNSDINQIENVKVRALGGVLYPGDAHLNPSSFLHALVKILESKGVKFLSQTEVVDFNYSKGKVNKILTNNDIIPISNLIIASGVSSARLLKKLGVKMLLQPGKGYSITNSDLNRLPKYPTILTEAKVAITPMGSKLRLGGTLELGNYNKIINKKRLEGILESVPQYYDDLIFNKQNQVWVGHRPCSPDGLPYIGKSSEYHNLYVGTGHGMMGMSMGPGTGKMISNLMKEQKSVVNLKKFNLR